MEQMHENMRVIDGPGSRQTALGKQAALPPSLPPVPAMADRKRP